MDPQALIADATARLSTRRLGRSIRGFVSVDSTNAVAWSWAAEGAGDGAVVLAEEQTAGRGRLGRSWSSEPGKNLTFSVVLRPELAPDRYGQIVMAAGVAVKETLDAFVAPVPTAIKWPNDVLLDGLKCCGMLLETSHSRIPGTVILGVGLNVNQQQFGEVLVTRATSMLLATGRPAPRAAVLAHLLDTLERHLDTLASQGVTTVHRAYSAALHGVHAPITLMQTGGGSPVDGTIVGVTDHGALRLDTGRGVETYYAGEVTTPRHDPSEQPR